MKNNPKIFLGFSEVANVYANLTKGFKKLKIDYTFITFGENIRKYDNQDKKSIFQILFITLSHRQSLSQGFTKRLYQALHILVRIPLFIKSIFAYDVFIFNYNSSFFGLYDLPILKFFNKKIIYCYFGSDGRAPYLSGNYILENYSLEQIYSISRNLYSKNQKIEKYANYILIDLNYTQFFSIKAIDFLHIGIPMDLSDINIENNNYKDKSSINIVHAPSTKKQKGSMYFSKIIKELQSEGFDINYIELSNVPNRVVLENLAVCDFVLDELYSDALMAGLATEAAYFAKPSVIGGYANFDSRINEVPPSLYVEPSQIKSAIIKLINDKEFRIELGNRAKQYVKNYRNPEAVANRFLRIINNDIPQEWFFDASKSDYFYGWGVSKEDLKEFLKKYVGKFGKEGLFLSHNPNLENKILEFIKE